LHFNTAFKQRDLIPGVPEYNATLRESIFLASKTGIRWAKGGYPTLIKVNNNTSGTHGEGAVGDLKRSLSQIFGDNNGNYPEGAYLNLFLIHNLINFEEVDVLYKGIETPLNLNENFGALIALRDYRDGTNFTGLNPNNEKLIKHIGFSGHRSAPVMMDMIRRDKWSLLDAMLITINVNDRRYLNMQYNAIEVAEAKDMGVIGMKVFADGAMYTKAAVWGNKPEELVFTVGSEAIPSKSLIEYSLTTPGVDTLIVGIGHINQDPLKCQLTQNLAAAQILPDALSKQERRELENLGLKAKDGKTNYFQLTTTSLTPPSNIKLTQSDNKVIISWDTAISGNEPVSHYEVLRDGIKIQEVSHFPQTSSLPFSCIDDTPGREYVVATVDLINRKALSNSVQYSPTGILNNEIQKVTIYAYRKEIFIQGISQDGMVASIYSLNGKLMKSFQLRKDPSKLYSFIVDDLKTGFYIVRIEGNGEIETGRIYLA
jgi:hypothetical protein